VIPDSLPTRSMILCSVFGDIGVQVLDRHAGEDGSSCNAPLKPGSKLAEAFGIGLDGVVRCGAPVATRVKDRRKSPGHSGVLGPNSGQGEARQRFFVWRAVCTRIRDQASDATLPAFSCS
jgi:hypothetical protein